MGKKVPFAKGRRICPFCQGESGSPISGEHIWPAWASDILPERGGKHEYNIVYTEGHTKVKKVKKDYVRPGSPRGVKIRLPCKLCNETWMGAIEAEAKPYLLPLINGKWIPLTDDARVVLSRWLFLKFLVLDGEGKEVPANTPEAYTKFRDDQTVPYDFKVWIGRTESKKWQDNYIMHSFSVRKSLTDSKRIDGRKNLNTFAIGLGSVFFFSIFYISIDADPEFAREYLTRIWPSAGGVNLPISPIPENTVDLIADWAPITLRSAIWLP